MSFRTSSDHQNGSASVRLTMMLIFYHYFVGMFATYSSSNTHGIRFSQQKSLIVRSCEQVLLVKPQFLFLRRSATSQCTCSNYNPAITSHSRDFADSASRSNSLCTKAPLCRVYQDEEKGVVQMKPHREQDETARIGKLVNPPSCHT